MKPEKRKVLSQFLNYGLILFLAVDVVFLTLQNKDLKVMLKSLSSASQPLEPLKSGEHVEPFSVQTLDGNTTVVKYSDPAKKYLFFVLSTTCPHCEKTLPIWKSIAKTNNDNCDVLGISIHSLQDTKKFIEFKDVGFYTVSAMNDTSFNRKYKIGGVPETILVDGNGVVEKTWIGELNSDQVAEIEGLMIAPKAVTN